MTPPERLGRGGAPGGSEEALRARLVEDPNDILAFAQLAEIVRKRATEGHVEGDPLREADDAIWALAEELAHSGRAWYPLIELARLSIDDDRDMALRRLGTASERDPTGTALAYGLRMLREAGHPGDALGLGVGHWRPHEHDVDAGRHLIEAAVEAGRHADARRHLEALELHPDRVRVASLRRELERLIRRSEPGPAVVDVRDGPDRVEPGAGPPTPGVGVHAPSIDLRQSALRPSVLARLRGLLHRR